MSCLAEVYILAPVDSSVIWLGSNPHVADILPHDSTKMRLICCFVNEIKTDIVVFFHDV